MTYKVREIERETFNCNWCGPDEEFEPGVQTLIAEYESQEGTTGLDVEVFITAHPSRQFKICARGCGKEVVFITSVTDDELTVQILDQLCCLLSDGTLDVRSLYQNDA